MGQYTQETRVLAFAIFIVFINILILHKTFSGLERENTIDPGGTEVEYYMYPQLQHSVNKYSVFESKLRKLTELSHDTKFDSVNNEFLLHTATNNDMFDCDDILSMRNKRFVASGWTKAVYRGDLKNQSYAIKTVSPQGTDISSCLDRGYRYHVCYNEAAKKIIKETSLLQRLTHPNIIKVLGYCVPNGVNNDHGVSMVTELGEFVELIQLLQMSWEDRLRVVYDMTKLLYFMAHNQIGSIAMNDFRRQQFVRVNNVLKLSDVDDISFGDPICHVDNDCSLTFPSANFTKRLSCLNSRCVGYNENRNIFNGGRHFTTFLLPHGAPERLKPLVNRVVHGYSNLTMNSRQLLSLMDKIVHMYSSGSYLQRKGVTQNTIYKRISNRDLPNVYDYTCRLSLTGLGCTVSVFDIIEAEELCNNDVKCKAFVVSGHRTWTGRIVIHLKSGIGYPVYDKDTHIYLKPV